MHCITLASHPSTRRGELSKACCWSATSRSRMRRILLSTTASVLLIACSRFLPSLICSTVSFSLTGRVSSRYVVRAVMSKLSCVVSATCESRTPFSRQIVVSRGPASRLCSVSSNGESCTLSLDSSLSLLVLLRLSLLLASLASGSFVTDRGVSALILMKICRCYLNRSVAVKV